MSSLETRGLGGVTVVVLSGRFHLKDFAQLPDYVGGFPLVGTLDFRKLPAAPGVGPRSH